MFGSSQSTPSSQAPVYLGVEVPTSVSTLPVPIVYGTQRVAPNLIWYGDYRSESQSQAEGGKGFGGGGQSDSQVYFASMIMALCEGPIQGIGQIWNGQTTYTLEQTGFSLFGGQTPQAPWSYLTSAHPDVALSYNGTAYLAVANYNLGGSPNMPGFNFEVVGAFAGTGFGPTGPSAYDADPALCIQDFLVNPQYGAGFPTASIDTTTLLSTAAATGAGDASLQTYCRALGICFSILENSQETTQAALERWLQLTNTAAVWSGTALKFIPYGDLPVSGNGVTFLPNATPIYDLTDDDFQGDDNDDPVQGQRIDVADAYNVEVVEVTDRSNSYTYVPVPARDETMANLYGERVDSTVTAHEICDQTIGAMIGQLILQRKLYVRNTYTFKLSWEYCLLEPMDLVTLTDPAMGLNKTPVRLTSIEEDENGLLTIQAEEFPSGIATATQYPKQARTQVPLNRNVAADPVNPPVIFEPSASLTNGTAQVWIAASGGSGGAADPNWGGANVWISPDNETYQQVGQIIAPARQGALTAALPAPAANPDTTSTLAVDLTESAGVLANANQADAAAARTLCWVDGELVAYATATLTAPSKYALSYLERGLYDTVPVAHQPGAQFVRLDSTIFKYNLPAAYVGQPIWIKLQSYNVFGGGVQDISTVEAYQLTPTGTGFFIAAPTDVVISSTATTQGDGSHLLSLVLTWQPSSGPLLDHYEVQYQPQGATAWLGATVGADQTDWVLVGAEANVTYEARVRAVSTVGNASAWTNAAATDSGALSSTVPSAPTGLLAFGGTEEITLNWSPNPEPDILGYRVLAAHGHDTAFADASLIAEGISGTYFTFADPGSYGDTWSFWLEAVNVAGISAPTGPVGGTTSFTIPIAALGQQVIAEDVLVPALQQKIASIDMSAFGQINDLGSLTAAWAAINVIQTTTEEADFAQAQQITSLGAEVSGNFAAYQQTLTAQAGINSATASDLETLTSQVGSNTASVSTLAQTIDGITAEYTIQVQALSNGSLALAGIGLIAGSSPAESEIILMANKLVVAGVDNEGNLISVSPFFVENGNVYIQALIAGTIDANQIGSGTITSAAITIQPTADSGGGLVVYTQDGTKILDSVKGIWPGAVTSLISFTGVAGSAPKNVATTVLSTAFVLQGYGSIVDVTLPTSFGVETFGEDFMSMQVYTAQLVIDGATVLTEVALSGTPALFRYVMDAPGTHTIKLIITSTWVGDTTVASPLAYSPPFLTVTDFKA
jgi:hypothetical protein